MERNESIRLYVATIVGFHKATSKRDSQRLVSRAEQHVFNHNRVILDFSEVNYISDDFIDEAVMPLVQKYGAIISNTDDLKFNSGERLKNKVLFTCKACNTIKL